MTRGLIRSGLAWMGAVLLLATPATIDAQQTRAELIAAQLAERASRIHVEPPGGLERTFLLVENGGLIERVQEGLGGVYPRFGGLSPGSGFAFGAGYRRFAGNDALFDAGYTGSFKGYQLVDARLTLPPVPRVAQLAVDFRFRDFPEEPYFGVGSDSSRVDRAHYGLQDTQVGVEATIRPLGGLLFRGGVGYLDSQISQGRGRFPSIEQRFTDENTPGLSSQPGFFTWRAGVAVDLRDIPTNARAGGLYTADVTDYLDRGLERYSFRRYVVQGIQYLPFFDRRRIFVLRARSVLSVPRPGHQVPFYLMPTLGGPETLRGFREYRFRDANSLLLTAEYRWEAFAALDMALFADAGDFAAEPSRLSVGDLNTSYGIGFRFSTRQKFVARVDIGTGREGTRVFARFVPIF